MTELLVCRACLTTDGKFISMHQNNLIFQYEIIIGTQILNDGLPLMMCSFCTVFLKKYASFRDQCLLAQQIMINADYNKIINTRQQKLVASNNLTAKFLNFINISPNEDTYTVFKEENVEETPLKCEVIDDDFSDDEPLAIKAKKRKENIPDVFENDDEAATDNFNDAFAGIDDDNATNSEKIANDASNFDATEKSAVDYKDVDIVVLTKEQQIEEILKRKHTSNYLNSFYKCDMCYRGFMTEGTFKNHMLKHDPVSGAYACVICKIRWTDIKLLHKHIAMSHFKNYVCRLCGQVSKSSYKAKEHIKWHNGHKYICKICGATFSKPTSHLTHVRIHHPSKHVCDVCGVSFVGANGLKIHKKRAHPYTKNTNINKGFSCVYCNQLFSNEEAYKTHIDKYINGICDPDLKHCVECGESLGNEEELKTHFREKHRKEKSVQCEQCNRTFAHERSYAVHYHRSHRQGAVVPQASRAVVCECCGLTCKTRSSLILHQRTHTGEKPYQCTECCKRFSIYQRLQIHIRTHTGERPFKCMNCPKAFKHKAALNRHNRVHTGVRPYSCNHCGKAFTQSNSLKTHIRSVHLRMGPSRGNRYKI